MIEGLVLGEVNLAAVRAFPQKEGTVTNFILEFGVFRYIDASVYYNFVLLSAFAARCECFVDY